MRNSKQVIDCLIIGHNEMNFADYEDKIRKMGPHTSAYRDLELNFIRHNQRPYTAAEVFNLFFSSPESSGQNKPLAMSETFSATISYLGTYLNRRGFSFDWLNSFQDSKKELAEKLSDTCFRAIAITTTLYVSVFPIIEIIDFVKRYQPQTKIIVGGPFIYTQYFSQEKASLEYLFQSVIDADFYVINPQGESALVEILRCLKNHLPLGPIPNVFRRTPGTVTWPRVSREKNSLDENMVNWELFAHRVGEYVNARTAISCPFHCSFCAFPKHAGEYQTAGIKQVEQELTSLDRIGSVKHVHFIDDTFNIPVKRFKDLLRMMIKNRFKFKWYSHFRCQFADREMIELMKESGCVGVFLGIESGSIPILKNMNKSVKKKQYLEGLELLKKQDILLYGSFIIGFPGETEETVRDTLRFIKESGLDFFRVQLWYCDPLTPIWQEREKYRLKGNSFKWSHATMDANRASDIVEQIFMSIEEPTWVPQYNFDFDTLFQLHHRGMDIESIKGFLRGFNRGVKEKLQSHSQADISLNLLEQIQQSLGEKHMHSGEPGPASQVEILDQFNAGFDFL